MNELFDLVIKLCISVFVVTMTVSLVIVVFVAMREALNERRRNHVHPVSKDRD